ncbi:hypothetical protein BLOT_006149 [Blomia tropicalis]|nr:hypothetical protein BLOT_006149 [Blomia tropicalis]
MDVSEEGSHSPTITSLENDNAEQQSKWNKHNETKDKEEQINDEMDPSVIDYVNKFIQRQSKRYIWKY